MLSFPMSHILYDLIILSSQLVGLEDDVEFEKDRSFRMRKALVAEQAQVSYLLDEYSEVRRKLAAFHSGKGWQMEAFLSVAGAI
jgi:hypothetical protein